MRCQFEYCRTTNGKHIHRCCVCGMQQVSKYDDPNKIHRVCRARNPLPIGDWVHNGLAAIGVTPDKVSKVTKKPCGCKKRQDKLNKLGAKIATKLGMGQK